MKISTGWTTLYYRYRVLIPDCCILSERPGHLSVYEVHPAAVLAHEALLPPRQTLLPLPQHHVCPVLDAAVDLVHRLVVLHGVGVGGHADGLALLIIRGLNINRLGMIKTDYSNP